MAITDATLTMRPGTSRKEIPDGKNGLYLIVQPSGRKSWAMRYRNAAGDQQRLTLGPVLRKRTEKIDALPAIGAAHTLKEARDQAIVQMGRVAQGADPAGERRAKRAPAPGNTVADQVEIFMLAMAKKRTAGEIFRRLDKHVIPFIGARRVDSITKADIAALCDRITLAGAPVLANRTFETVRLFFKWLAGRGAIATVPTDGMKKPNPDHEIERDRVLSDAELRKVWKAAAELGQPFGPIVRLLILTGQRRGEIAGMKDSEIDRAAAMLTIPAERVKNKRVHTVPLTAAALAEIDAVERTVASDLLFTTTGDAPVSGWGRMKRRLDKLAGFDDWTVHDLRRTVATGMQRLAVPLQVTEAVLNHVSGSRDGIVGIYQQHNYADEKREALTAWARHVQWTVAELKSSDGTADEWTVQAAFDYKVRHSDAERTARLKAAHKLAINGTDKEWQRHFRKWKRYADFIARQPVQLREAA